MIPKFRVWSKEHKQMGKVDSLEYFRSSNLEVDYYLGSELYSNYVTEGYDDPDGIVLMQSTGLTDKNGKEIFEGDVIKYQCTFEVHGTDEPEFAFVEFKNTLPYANHGRAELTLDDLLLDGSEWVLSTVSTKIQTCLKTKKDSWC